LGARTASGRRNESGYNPTSPFPIPSPPLSFLRLFPSSLYGGGYMNKHVYQSQAGSCPCHCTHCPHLSLLISPNITQVNASKLKRVVSEKLSWQIITQGHAATLLIISSVVPLLSNFLLCFFLFLILILA